MEDKPKVIIYQTPREIEEEEYTDMMCERFIVTREKLRAEIQKQIEYIERHSRLLTEAKQEDYLFNDEKQWFTEEMEPTFYRGPSLIGRIHWIEDFKDEATGTTVPIERTKIVRVNGEWE